MTLHPPRILPGLAFRIATAVATAALSVSVLAGCTDDTDPVPQKAPAAPVTATASATPTGGDSPSASESPLRTEDATATPKVEGTSTLDHDSALAAGFAGDARIKCLYTFDADEIAEMRQLASGGSVSPVADIYLDGGLVYWEVAESAGRIAHILRLDGSTHTWVIPGDGTGVAFSNPEGDMARLAGRLALNASGCAAYPGPQSVFELPAGIDFVRIDDLG